MTEIHNITTVRQDEDGTPYFGYFIREHGLAFVWDGKSGTIEVAYGGMGEPVDTRFHVPEKLTRTYMPAGKLLAEFKDTCEHWANTRYAFNGYANEETLAFFVHAPNVWEVNQSLLDVTREFLRHVPNMTDLTLGVNIKDSVRLWCEQAANDEPIRSIGWADGVPVKATRAQLLALANDVGDLSHLHETDLGEHWREAVEG
jgi:hypothetical protein